MSSAAAARSPGYGGPDGGERLVATVPFGLLTVSVVSSVAVRRGEAPGELPVDLALAAAAALWLLGRLAVAGRSGGRRPRVEAVFFTGWWALTAALVVQAPWFGFFAFSGYLLAGWALAGRAQLAGVLGTAVLGGTSQHGGLPALEAGPIALWAVLVAVNVVLASYFFLTGLKVERQSEDRRQALVELEAANGRLERSLQVNAELHEALLERAREAGVLGERQRLAGEIHDTLAQDLVGIVTQLEAAEAALAPGDAEPRRRLAIAAELARGALTEARRSVHALRPAPLDARRLPDALTDVAGRWSEIHGVDASVECHGEARPLRPELEVTVLRTAQEALANVARHAGAGRVGLTLSYMDDVVTLDVRDDGVGFAPQAAPRPAAEPQAPSGFGLIAMRQRIQGVAGTLSIESEPGGGTALSASVPALAVDAR